MSRRRLRSVAQALILLLILVFWARALLANWDSFTTFPWQFSWLPILLALLVRFVQMIINATIWWQALALADARIPYRTGLSLYLTTQIARYLPGGVWDIVGRFVLGKEAGVSNRSMATSIGLEMGLQILSGSVFLLAALFLHQNIDAERYIWIGVLTALGTLVVLSPPVFTFLTNTGLRLLKKPPLTMHLTYANMIVLFLARLFSHSLVGLAFYLFVQGLSVVPAQSAPLIITSYVGSWLIGYLAILVPMGLGIREGVLALLLGGSIPFALITTSAIGYRVLIAVRDMLAALFGLWLKPKPHPDASVVS